ncbi:MAG: gliding motility-associated C-terminal domain-containing protein [Bacteroidetes bacterium]|nr:gliding motility-associated C-terminal domain-containing protein [Bacteroidota bacterium]
MYKLIVANDSVCYDTLLINNYIQVYPLPNANFSYVISPVGSLIPGNTVIFTDSSILASAWNWTFGDGNGDAIEKPTHQYDAGGNYIATLFITSDDGCTDTISKLIELGVFPTLYVPNSFTPNNDGKNEMFEIKGSDILESNIIIYNRWGQPVFTSDNAKKIIGTVAMNLTGHHHPVYTFICSQ